MNYLSIFGILLSIFNTFIGTIGKQMMKLSHLYSDRGLRKK